MKLFATAIILISLSLILFLILFIILPATLNAGHPTDFSSGFSYKEKVWGSVAEKDLTEKVSVNLYALQAGGEIKIEPFNHQKFFFGERNKAAIEKMIQIGKTGKLPMPVLQTKIHEGGELVGYTIETVNNKLFVVTADEKISIEKLAEVYKFEYNKTAKMSYGILYEITLTEESVINVLELSSKISENEGIVSCRPEIIFLRTEILE